MIRFEGVSKRFGETWAVRDVSLDITAGEFFCLLGPSGSGKSTLMRLLAGFEQPDAGVVRLDGEDLAGRPPHLRPVNMMFQSYALFPHLSVARNVAYGLEQARLGKAEVAARTAEMLALVGLSDLGGRKPAQLSGGQMQRVALARALARRPRVLLLDEPLAALDQRLRESTRAELKAIQQRLGTTFVMVTHDKDEAMALADRIAIMNDGAVVQVAPPRQMYQAPADRFVAGFLGEVNLIPVEGGWRAVRPEAVGLTAVDEALGGFGSPPLATASSSPLHPLRGSPSPAPESAEEALFGHIARATYLGDRIAYVVTLDEGPDLKVQSAVPFEVGQAVRVTMPPGAVLTR